MVLAVINGATHTRWGNDQALDDISLVKLSTAPSQSDAYMTKFGVSVNKATLLMSGNVFSDLNYSFSKNTGDVGIANPVVRITGGYGFGPNHVDNGGRGDDVAVSTPITAAVGAAIGNNLSPPVVGDYVFVDLPIGK